MDLLSPKTSKRKKKIEKVYLFFNFYNLYSYVFGENQSHNSTKWECCSILLSAKLYTMEGEHKFLVEI